MHRCMLVLAIIGVLTGHVPAADDPFDFSSPLQGGTTRTAQYFSRTSAGNENGLSENATTAGSTQSGRSAAMLLEEEPAEGTARRLEPSVRFGEAPRSTATRRPAAAPNAEAMPQRNPEATLRRFDEFLKSRDVVSAEYSESSQQTKGRIQQIQMEDDLPAFGDLDATPGAQPTAEPVSTTENLLLRDRSASAGERLTDPIPTSFIDESPSTFDPGLITGKPLQSELRSPAPAGKTESSMSVGRFGASSSAVATSAKFTRTAPVNDDQAKEIPPAIQTAWTLLDPLNVGQQCRAELVVTNTGSAPAERVSLEVRIPETVRVIEASPLPVEQVAFLGWKIPSLAGGESMTIEVVFLASTAGPLDLATYVRHTSAQQNSYTITQPMLELTVTGPEQVHVGEPASQTLLVKNAGTGTATNVTIDAVIPSGLEHATGEHLQMDIGSLNPGEVRSIRLVMAAVGGGKHKIQVEARADAGIVRNAAAEVAVIAPSLRTGIVGPSLRYLGREAEYTIRVLNDGSAATDFVQVNHRIPEGFDFVRANRGASFDANTRVLNWYVGRLESGESLDLNLALLPTAAGEYTHLVRATSETGANSDAQFTTKVQGAASLVFKVSDLDDPVEVETETAYEVTITNEGTAAARDVGLTCELPQGLAFLKAEGPSDHKLQNEFIGFRPIEELAPGKSLVYRVHVKGAVAGDQRFRCRLMSEALKQPLFTEELTKFYSE